MEIPYEPKRPYKGLGRVYQRSLSEETPPVLMEQLFGEPFPGAAKAVADGYLAQTTLDSWKGEHLFPPGFQSNHLRSAWYAWDRRTNACSTSLGMSPTPLFYRNVDQTLKALETNDGHGPLPRKALSTERRRRERVACVGPSPRVRHSPEEGTPRGRGLGQDR